VLNVDSNSREKKTKKTPKNLFKTAKNTIQKTCFLHLYFGAYGHCLSGSSQEQQQQLVERRAVCVCCRVSVTPAARQHHRDQLARLLRQRPAQRELVERNIIYLKTEQERREDRERIGIRLNRRLSLRPTADELQQKNILHCTSEQLARNVPTYCAAVRLKLCDPNAEL